MQNKLLPSSQKTHYCENQFSQLCVCWLVGISCPGGYVCITRWKAYVVEWSFVNSFQIYSAY